MPAASMVREEFTLLGASFAGVTDGRFARGKGHPLPGVLALVALGLMADCRSLSAISRYGQIPHEVLGSLGLRRGPSVATLHRLPRSASVAVVRAALASFTRRVLAARAGRSGVGAAAVDGKTSREVREAGAQLHVPHVFAHRRALAFDQVAAGTAPVETMTAQDWLATAVDAFPGLTVLTGDALYAEQDLCAAVVAGQRDYVPRPKKTSPPSTPTSPSSSPPPALPTPSR